MHFKNFRELIELNDWVYSSNDDDEFFVFRDLSDDLEMLIFLDWDNEIIDVEIKNWENDSEFFLIKSRNPISIENDLISLIDEFRDQTKKDFSKILFENFYTNSYFFLIKHFNL